MVGGESPAGRTAGRSGGGKGDKKVEENGAGRAICVKTGVEFGVFSKGRC